jgi:hypothetical protein
MPQLTKLPITLIPLVNPNEFSGFGRRIDKSTKIKLGYEMVELARHSMLSRSEQRGPLGEVSGSYQEESLQRKTADLQSGSAPLAFHGMFKTHQAYDGCKLFRIPSTPLQEVTRT